MSGQVKGSCNKYRGLVHHGAASNDCNRTVAIGSRVSVERSVKYMEYDSMTTALEIMDWYIEHYTKLEHNDTVRKLKEIRVDMENAERFMEVSK